jgi:6-phosphogluconolactonase
VDKAGKNVLVANYGGGSVACLQIRDDGAVSDPTAFLQHTGTGMSAGKPKPPHAHSINLDAANRIAFAADAGLDKIFLYDFDVAMGGLAAHKPPFVAVESGRGPRHFAFHPEGKFAYAINETVCSMTAFSYDAERGELKELQTVSTLPAGESVKPGYSTAEVVAHRSGRFLYGSNRGHDTIAVFEIAADGRLKLVQNQPTGGKIPRNFNVDPTGAYLFAANASSDNIVLFKIDANSGRLTETGKVLAAPSPVCLRFVKVL